MNGKTASLISKILAGLIFVSTIDVVNVSRNQAHFCWNVLVHPALWTPISLFVAVSNFLGIALYLAVSLELLFGKRRGYAFVCALPLASLLSGDFFPFVPFVLRFVQSTNAHYFVFIVLSTLIINLLVIATLIWTHRVMRRQTTQD